MKKWQVKIFLISGVFFLISCKKDDTTPPTITLKGNSFITLNLGDTYTDAGASAEDNKDGDVTNKIIVSGIPENTYHAGEYLIEYNAEDASGNTALQVVRTIHIRTDKLAGKYMVKETNDVDNTERNYVINVKQSDSVYNKLYIYNFRNLDSTIRIATTISRTKDKQANDNSKKDTIIILPQIIKDSALAVLDTISGLGGSYEVLPPKFELSTIKYNMRGLEKGIKLNKNYLITILNRVETGKKK